MTTYSELAITTELLMVTAGRTHKATGAAIESAAADVIACRRTPERLMIVLDTEADGTRYGIQMRPYGHRMYSACPSVMRPSQPAPVDLAPLDAPVGCIIHCHPVADTGKLRGNSRAFALLSKRLARLRRA